MRLGSIYLVTCLCTEKVYVGQTVLNPPMKRWIEHYEDSKNSELYLHRAIK